MHSRVIASFEGQQRVIGDFTPSESIRISGHDSTDFSMRTERHERVRDLLGSGSRFVLTGTAASLKKTVTVTVYDQFPRMAFFDVAYTNTGRSDLAVNGWTNQHYSISARAGTAAPAFWSYQSGSYREAAGLDSAAAGRLQAGKLLGHERARLRGWHSGCRCLAPDVGIGVGHLEMVPKQVSLPVTEPTRTTLP